MIKTCGIYAIRNTSNGHRYVGSSVCIEKRWAEHRRTLQLGRHHSVALQRAWAKYGEKAFVLETLESVEDPQGLIAREQVWIDNTPRAERYNVCQVAGIGSQLGLQRSEATRQKLREARSHQSMSLETRHKIGKSNRGQHRSELARQHLREGRGHRSPSEATKLKIQTTLLRTRPWAGKHHTAETKEKQRQALLGKPRTLKTRRKMAANRHTKLTWLGVDTIRELHRTGTHSARELAVSNNVSVDLVYQILREERWNPRLRPEAVTCP